MMIDIDNGLLSLKYVSEAMMNEIDLIGIHIM